MDPPLPSSPTPAWRDRIPDWIPVWISTPSRAAAALAGTAAAVAVAVLVLRPGAAPPAQLTLPRAAEAAPRQTGDGAADPAPVGGGGTAGAGSPELLAVHVAGAVAQPGVYMLATGSRVADAVGAAGGGVPEAQLGRLNLAAKVADGERIWVPRADEPGGDSGGALGPGGSSGPGGPPTTLGPLDLNTATQDQLDTLPGVGPATATAILSYRARNGPFRSVTELLEVPGIGPAKLETLRPLVRV